MNLCGEMNAASRYDAGSGERRPAMSMSTYGVGAVKSQKPRTPALGRSSAETPAVSEMMSVTLDAVEKDLILSGRAAYFSSWVRRSASSMPPSGSWWMTTTSAIDSRHGISLEWCSYGPTNTTGRSSDQAMHSGGRSNQRRCSKSALTLAGWPARSGP